MISSFADVNLPRMIHRFFQYKFEKIEKIEKEVWKLLRLKNAENKKTQIKGKVAKGSKVSLRSSSWSEQSTVWISAKASLMAKRFIDTINIDPCFWYILTNFVCKVFCKCTSNIGFVHPDPTNSDNINSLLTQTLDGLVALR